MLSLVIDFWGRQTNLNIDFVPAQHDWNVFADTLKITVPIRHVFVGDSRCHIKHDDPTLALDVVPISEPTEFFLSGSIPDVETDGTKVCREFERVHLNTQRG
jgi:hypothetical protein